MYEIGYRQPSMIWKKSDLDDLEPVEREAEHMRRVAYKVGSDLETHADIVWGRRSHPVWDSFSMLVLCRHSGQVRRLAVVEREDGGQNLTFGIGHC